MSKLKKIILAGLLLSTTIVLSRFLSIKTPILVISFSYLPIMISAILLGPFHTALISGLADLIGALLFPFSAYFIGYTISAILTGFIYGLFLYAGKKQYSKKSFLLRLILSTFIVILFCNTLLNTLWIYITTKNALIAILPARLIKQLVMLPIQVISVFGISLALKKINPTLFNFAESKVDNLSNKEEE